MLDQILESFFSKAGEKLVDYAQGSVWGIKDYKLTLETLERNLNSLCSKANDVEEEIKTAEMSGKKKRKREVGNWLKEIQILQSEFHKLEMEIQSQGFIRRFLGGDAAAKLNARVCELVEQSRHFGELILDKSCNGEPLLTAKLVGEAFEQNLERIWKFLTTDKVSSIGIYGMGGVGKTTLTKHVHNRLLKSTENFVFWITVSQECSTMMLQDKIANVLGLDLSDEHNEDKRAARLNQALFMRNISVLILDDVWKKINLEKVGDPLRVEGCKLILTTRSLEVCRQVGCEEIVEVKTLDKNESWNLFRETLGRETKLIAPEVQGIAKSMAKMCDGLPLGIITVAGSMRRVTSIHVWRNALEELKESIIEQDDDEESVFKVLKYSFDRLDLNHQRCFLYCSLYPEAYEVSTKELVSKFISEELVDKRKSRKAQLDQGHSILDKLVNVCLLENVQYDRVKMHDLLRAMALKITRGKTMVIAGCSLNHIPNEEEYWTKDLEKMSLMCNEILEIPTKISPNCPKLSTLLLEKNPLKFISDTFFSQMNGLCILDLSQTNIKELPNSLSNLEGLKVLILRYCKHLVNVPCLGKLKALRELDLSSTRIIEVPQGMEKLVNLKFLSLNRAHCLKMLPRDLLLNFPYLQCLHLPYQIQTPIEEVEGLKQLQDFRGRVKDTCDFNRFIRSQEGKGYSICYFILVGDCMEQEGASHMYYKKEGKDEIMLSPYWKTFQD